MLWSLRAHLHPSEGHRLLDHPVGMNSLALFFIGPRLPCFGSPASTRATISSTDHSLSAIPAAIEGVFTRRNLATDDGRADYVGGGASHLGCLGAWLPSVFHPKFAYETIVHANRSFMPIDFPLGCFDPCAAGSALAILQLA